MLTMFYTEKQSVATNASFSPSAGKPALVANLFSKNPKVKPNWLVQPCTRPDIKLAHDPKYVDGILDLTIPNGFGNFSREVGQSLHWTTGSFYSAARFALKNKTVTFSPTSGFHHAEHNHGGGFCTFNGLMITALLLKKFYDVKKVVIVDFDAHYGNGTDNIIKTLGLEGWVENYTFGWFAEVVKESTGGFDDWLDRLETYKLKEVIEGADIVLYQAGADPHVDDPFGGYLTTSQMRRRDKLVFETANKLGVPLVWNLAGGYQQPIDKVLELHNNTLEECIRAYGF